MENLNLMSVEVMAIGDLVLNKIDDLCAKRKILYLNGKSAKEINRKIKAYEDILVKLYIEHETMVD